MITIFVSLESRQSTDIIESFAQSLGATPTMSAPRAANGKEVDIFVADDVDTARSVAEQTQQTIIIVRYESEIGRRFAESVVCSFRGRVFAVHWVDSISLLRKIIEEKKKG